MAAAAARHDLFEAISPLTPNKFICIQFPLSPPAAAPAADPAAAASAGSVLTRFHSFRLDDKLVSHAAQPLAAPDALSRSNLDLQPQ